MKSNYLKYRNRSFALDYSPYRREKYFGLLLRKRLWAAAMILALLIATIYPTPVSAHATLLRSDPADGMAMAGAPDEVHLWFDEAISGDFSSARLLDSNSRPVDGVRVRSDPADATELTILLPTLESGVYSILWKVLSESDGHFSQGIMVFTVGTEANLSRAHAAPPKESLPIVEVLLRWANFGSLAGVVGAMAIVWFVLGVGLAGNMPNDTVRIQTRRRVFVWARLCTMAALVAGGCLLIWQTYLLASSVGSDSLMVIIRQMVLGTRWGLLWMTREGLLVLLWYLLGRALFGQVSLRGEQLLHGLIGLLLLSLLTVQALSGHASGISDNVLLAVVNDVVHLLAASVWMGGLVALLVGLGLAYRERPRIYSQRDVDPFALSSLRAFGSVALLSVGLLFATGLYSMGQQVASIDGLIASLYGQTLLIKIGFVLVIGLVGFLNTALLHKAVTKVLRRLLRRPEGWTPIAAKRLPLVLGVEALIGISVLLLTGALTASRPPRGIEYTLTPGDISSSLSQNVDDLVVTLLVKPNRPGRNVFSVFTASTLRPAPAEITRVLLRFSNSKQGLGLTTAAAEEVDAGRYLLTGSFFGLAGEQEVNVVVRRNGLKDSVANFRWVVAPAAETTPLIVSKQAIAPLLTIAAALLIIVTLGIVAGIQRYQNRHIRKRPEVLPRVAPQMKRG